jgi:hypothetical protein
MNHKVSYPTKHENAETLDRQRETLDRVDEKPVVCGLAVSERGKRKSRDEMCFLAVALACVLVLAGCEGSQTQPEATTAAEQPKPAKPGLPVTSATTVKSCEQRFTPIGMVLTRAAMDTKTGQQCRTAENAPPAFKSLPMCADLLSRFPD